MSSSSFKSPTPSLASEPDPSDESDLPQPSLKYGEEAIAQIEFVTFPNPRIGRNYTVTITLPEFTCKCPFSGYPDFATFTIAYTPGPLVLELKSLKLYINSYRDRYIAHETVTHQILDDFVAACKPVRASIRGDFNPRGNVHTVVEASYEQTELLEEDENSVGG
jgi:7-cyano-7-deazaguanine reductase